LFAGFELVLLTGFATSILAQDVQIPDSGLNIAIRATLGKLTGPLTVQDMLSLTNLSARNRGVSSLAGWRRPVIWCRLTSRSTISRNFQSWVLERT
jgi:hypothetical protein